MPPMQYFPKAQSTFVPPLVANENAYLGDIASSNSPTAPLSSGFYRLEAGTPLDYTYSYDEMKIVLEGHFYVKDETGNEVKAEKGDVFYFAKGSRIVFRTEEYGLAFFVGQRVRDTL